MSFKLPDETWVDDKLVEKIKMKIERICKNEAEKAIMLYLLENHGIGFISSEVLLNVSDENPDMPLEDIEDAWLKVKSEPEYYGIGVFGIVDSSDIFHYLITFLELDESERFRVLSSQIIEKTKPKKIEISKDTISYTL
jgi:hypothetical protein